MPEVTEFVVVLVGDKRRSIDNLGGTIHANPGEAEVNFILRVQSAYGGEWDGTSDSIGWRYTRVPSESPAERVARELWRLGRTVRVEEAEFVRQAAELIAAVAEPTACPECQRDKAAMHCEWCCLEVRQDIERERDELREKVAELEAALKSQQSNESDFLAMMAQWLSKWPHDCDEHSADTPPMFWPGWISCIIRRTVKDRTKELESHIAQLESRRATAELAAYARDRWRERWEQLRDAIKKPVEAGTTWASIATVISSEARSYRAGDSSDGWLAGWAAVVLPRLEAALAEPEQPHVA